MATEINRELFDTLIKNQIAVGRYSAGQARDIVSLLNKANKELVEKIEAWGESERFTPTRLKALFKELKATIDETYNEAATQLRDEMGEFAFHAGEVSASGIATQMPVTWSAVAMTQEQIAAIIDKTPIRIGKDKTLLFDEIFKNLAGGYEEKVRGMVRLGMVEGETMKQIADRVAKGFDAPRRELSNLVHTVVQHTNNQAAALTMQNNSEVVKGFVSVATLDSKTCFFCISRSGKQFKLTDPGPVWHISCRCFRAPITKTFKELGFDMPEFAVGQRASASGPVRADISFHDWLKTQPVKMQTELLGPARQKLFADGKIQLDKLVDSSGKTYTLDQLKKQR